MIKRGSRSLIGLFVLGALALMVAAVLVLGSGQLFKRTYKFALFFDGNVNGLRIGAAVKFRGVEVGRVTDIRLNMSPPSSRAGFGTASPFRTFVLIEVHPEKILTARNIELSNQEQFDVLIQQGLRGQLAMESILTGMLYVDLEMRPDTEAKFVMLKNAGYHDIPTLPTQFEQVQEQAAAIVGRLNQVDFAGAVGSAKGTADTIRGFVGSRQFKATVESMQTTLQSMDKTLAELRVTMDTINGQLRPLMMSADSTLNQAKSTLSSMQASVEPDSPLTYKLNKTLDEVSAAAVSMRQLTDYLQRNPSAIIRGKDFSASTGAEKASP